MKTPLKVCCFGEVLWDVFPEGKQIGGAPLNVTLRLNSFGVDSSIISAVGNDDLAKEALQLIADQELSTEFIQLNSYPTGTVPVTIDKNGSAYYTIAKPVAWDFITLNRDVINTVKASDAIVYGSLSCRSEVTKETLLKLIDQAGYRIFDINLRAPHFEKDTLFNLMNKADMIKFNDEEIERICEMNEVILNSIDDQVKYIAKITNTDTICVTLGGDGALLFQKGAFYRHHGYHVQVKDTVGAGDSFLAALIFKLLNDESAEIALDFACAVGALVASNHGANAVVALDEIESMKKR